MLNKVTRLGSARLAPPEASADFVPRPRVTALLDAAVARPLTLITGGPGTGKTDAVADWARQNRGPGPVAWVGIDRAVRTAPRAWAAIIASLNDALGEETLGGLHPPPAVDEYFIATLRDRLDGHDVVLVIDDVHEAVPDVLTGLDQLLHAPPEGLHTVLVSRHPPALSLNRHRLAGRLSEVRFDELAFTHEEVRPLAAKLGTVADDALLDDLQRVTGGWAAGLRLALLAMEGTDDPRGVLGSFNGAQPLVEGYLTEELERSLGSDLFDVLIRTCVTDRINAPLAIALTGDAGLSAQLWTRLGEAPLVAQLTDSGWFRYHPLLQQMLRSRLERDDPALLADLHSRAAAWFERQGDAMTALDHAIDSGDAALAVQVALRSATVEFVVGDKTPLCRSIARIPPTGPSLRAEMLALRAVEAQCRGHHAAASELAARAEPLIDALPEPRRSIALVNIHVVRAMIARLQGDALQVTRSGLLATHLLAGLEPDDAPGWCAYRGLPHTLVGIGHLWSGHPTAAVTSLQESRDIDPASPFTDYAQLSHGSHTALALVIQGSQDEGLALARRIVTVAQEMGRPVTAHTAQAWIALAVVAQLRHTPDELESILPSAERAVAEATDPFTRVCLHLLRFVSALFRGERPAAVRELARARALLTEHPGLVYASRLCTALEVRMAAEGGDPLDSAQRLLAEHDDREHAWRQAWAEAEASGDARLPAASAEADALTIMRGRLLLASDPQRVRDVVAPASALPGMVGVLAWVAIAQAEDQMRHDSLALEAMGIALERAAPGRISAPFLVSRSGRVVEILRRHLELVGTHAAFVEEVLSVVDRAPTATREKPRAAEPLTDRERVVVGYLPTMRSNAEIAEALQISVNTVKQHLKSVHRKLGVSSRREVVRVARDLDLLP